ncbi:MAG TPA: hypothetical protein VK544_09980, partial [Gemmatimonadaceae bacterium]|nr:hypothetical protein [Gemmatimonadaceae bacterium]
MKMASRSIVGLLGSLLVACAPAMHAPPVGTRAARELAPGVSYSQFTDPRGPWAFNLVRVDLRRANIE